MYDIFKGGRADARPPCLFEKGADMKNVLYGKCVKCGNCVTVCKFHAVEKK